MILDYIKQIDWTDVDNKSIAQELIADAIEYLRRVEAHIYEGNEIRLDSFMDIADKKDAIKRLDDKRTDAHNKMLVSLEPFINLLTTQTSFNKEDYKLDNRTQKADFVAMIWF